MRWDDLLGVVMIICVYIREGDKVVVRFILVKILVVELGGFGGWEDMRD